MHALLPWERRRQGNGDGGVSVPLEPSFCKNGRRVCEKRDKWWGVYLGETVLGNMKIFTIARNYHSKVLDHYTNPRNVGTFSSLAGNVGTGLVGAPACGDVMRLQIKVGVNDVIEDVKFKTFGCGSAIASSSLATELIKGKTFDEALNIKNIDIARELSLPPVKLHCSLLAEDAIKSAIMDYKKKKGLAPPAE